MSELDTKIAVLETSLKFIQDGVNANTEALSNHNAVTNHKLDEILKDMRAVSAVAQKALEIATKLETKVEKQEKIMDRGLGVVMVFSGFAGVIGAVATKIIVEVFSRAS